MRVKDMHKTELPRERLRKHGTQQLSDSELLAIVLGSGIKGTNVIELAKKTLRILANSKEDAVKNKLEKVRGLGPAKVSQILAIIELSKRIGHKPRVDIKGARDIWALCADVRDSKREHFIAFFIDTQGRLIERRIISIGTLTESLVHPRELFEPAVTLQAHSILVAHNHPSGDVTPSEADIALTQRLTAAGELMGVKLLDHVIVTKGQYLSFKDRKVLS